jgi:hypothetical protein
VELELQPLHQAAAVVEEVDHPQEMALMVDQVVVVLLMLALVELEQSVKVKMVVVNRLEIKLVAVVERLLLVLVAVE